MLIVEILALLMSFILQLIPASVSLLLRVLSAKSNQKGAHLDFEGGIVFLGIPGAQSHLEALDGDLVGSLGIHGPVDQGDDGVLVDRSTRVERIRETDDTSNEKTSSEDKVDSP